MKIHKFSISFQIKFLILHAIMDIRLDNLSIGYKKRAAVANSINATIRAGELSCLIGRNGTGKSTLLKTIAGFLPAKEGKVWIGDNDIAVMSQHDRAVSVGVVLTKTPNVQNLTVREMVSLGRSPYTGFFGKLSANDERIVGEAMAMVGIDSLADRMIQALSDGERQKTMIARALAQQTAIILLDEPTAFLDYPSKVELMTLLRQLAHEHNKTLLMSTHDLDLCVGFADSLFLLDKATLQPVSKTEISNFIHCTMTEKKDNIQ